MPWPVTLSDGQPVTTSWLNSVAQAPASWQGLVNANNNSLTNANSVSCQTLLATLATITPAQDGYAAIQLRSPSNNAKMFSVWVESAANSCTVGYWTGSQFGNMYLQGTVLCPYRVSIGTDAAQAKLTVVPDGDGQTGIRVQAASTSSNYLAIKPESSSATCSIEYWAGAGIGNLYLGANSVWCDHQIGAMTLRSGGDVILNNIPTSNPGAGTKKVWADPADGYRLKLAY